MKERHIDICQQLIPATLDGSKTITRRLIKGVDSKFLTDFFDVGDSTLKGDEATYDIGQKIDGDGVRVWLADYPDEGSELIKCPYGKVGDRLLVREGIKKSDIKDEYGNLLQYSADNKIIPYTSWCWKRNSLPSRFMPNGLSRITLEITDIYVEKNKESVWEWVINFKKL